MNLLTIVLAIIAIAIVVMAIYSTREIVRMVVEALNNIKYDESDELEYRDDPYAVLCYVRDEMRDDLHVEHAKEVLQKRAFSDALQLDISHCTCLKCNEQQNCAWAFDPYNTDGDCIMTK